MEYVHLDKVVAKAKIPNCVNVQEYREALPTRFYVRATFGCKKCRAARKSFRLCFPRELLMFHMLLKKFKLYLTRQSMKTSYCDHLLLFASILHYLGRKPRMVDLTKFRLEQSELDNTKEMFKEVTAQFLPNDVPFCYPQYAENYITSRGRNTTVHPARQRVAAWQATGRQEADHRDVLGGGARLREASRATARDIGGSRWKTGKGWYGSCSP